MKLKQILNEIGDSNQIPSGAKFLVLKNSGEVEFSFLGDKYLIHIRIPIQQNNRIALTIDFYTLENNMDLTNKGQALKVMSYVVGCIEEWIKRYNKKFNQTEIVYIKYDPKSEESEEQDFDKISKNESANKRDRLYRTFIEKFAKRYNSNVTFTTQGGVVAKFEPNLIVK